MTAQDPTHRAADLAEQIVDEVANVDHDWRLIARLARELAQLADGAAEAPTDDPGARPSAP
jgi:hypothetical protein